VHRLGLRLFGAMVWRLLIIEPFFNENLQKSKKQKQIGIWGHSCCWKYLGESNLLEFIS
jgi:hypothetical protein